MNILVVGNERNGQECREKFGTEHTWWRVSNYQEAQDYLETTEVIFDFIPGPTLDVKIFTHQIVFLNTTFITLSTLLKNSSASRASFFGFCGLPTFLNRERLEVSVANEGDVAGLKEICGRLNTMYSLVADTVGMVTPRIVCMIINEAYYTVAEGTATRSDIDLAMKLGTNYPYGPFEWAERIGLNEVYEVLLAVHTTTRDERYLICPLLKKEAGF
ncbi:MAG: 3-hydroxyacyl-CoA dehydrogenase [Cyclobacteriaceae bacterium]|nr:3-hydroxyacyl-CoA dehydrogenase [Cyclobacteriaceae bacterium]